LIVAVLSFAKKVIFLASLSRKASVVAVAKSTVILATYSSLVISTPFLSNNLKLIDSALDGSTVVVVIAIEAIASLELSAPTNSALVSLYSTTYLASLANST
jgi:hypothetical protein